jgi:hypothetical protein
MCHMRQAYLVNPSMHRAYVYVGPASDSNATCRVSKSKNMEIPSQKTDSTWYSAINLYHDTLAVWLQSTFPS